MSRKAALFHRIITSLGRQHVPDSTPYASKSRLRTRTRHQHRQYVSQPGQARQDASTLSDRSQTYLPTSSVRDAVTLALLDTLRQQLATGRPSSNHVIALKSTREPQSTQRGNRRVKGQVEEVGDNSLHKSLAQDDGEEELWLSPGSTQEIIERVSEEPSSNSQDDLFEHIPVTHVVGPQGKLSEQFFPQDDVPATLIADTANPDGTRSSKVEKPNLLSELPDENVQGEAVIQAGPHKHRQDFISSRSSATHAVSAASEEIITIYPTKRARRVAEAKWREENGADLKLPPRNYEVRTELLETTYQNHLKPMPTPEALDIREKHWQLAFRNLKSITSHNAEDHTPCQEVVHALQGWSFTWTGDPGETLTQLRESTGSNIHAIEPQGRPNRLDSHFESFLLEGTPPQNRAALHYIQTLEKLELTSESTHRSQAFTQQQVVVVRRAEGAVSNIRITSTINKAQSIDLRPFMLAAKEGVALPPLLLNAAVRLLISSPPFKVPTQRLGGLKPVNTQATVANALRLLLCDPSNVSSTMSRTLARAFSYLSRRRRYNCIRAIMSAHDNHYAGKQYDGVRALDTDAFNALLRDTTFTNKVHSFDFITDDMRRRGVAADTDTWLHFLTLTKNCAPSKTDQIIDCLRKYGMLELPRVKRYMIRAQLAEQLEQELASSVQPDGQLPEPFIQDFVAAKAELYGSTWLAHVETEIMLDVLLPRGYWTEALNVCQLMLEQMHGMTKQIFGRFLLGASLAKRHAPAYAVELLQRFTSMLRSPNKERNNPARGANVARSMQDELSRRHVMRLESQSYDIMFGIARAGQSWNLLRTVWHHACCYGMVTFTMRRYMIDSLKLYATLDAGGFLQLDDERFFEASFAAFALGIGTQPGYEGADSKPLESNEGAIQDKVYRDQAAFDQVIPLNSLAVDAHFALVRDQCATFQAWRRTIPDSSMVPDKVLLGLRRFRIEIPVIAVSKESSIRT